MKFYVAAHDRLLASLVAGVITRAGHECTSTWIKNEFLPTDEHTIEVRMSIAFEDVEDVCRSDVLVLVAGAEKYSGGKFVEAGIAMGRGIPVIVIGRRENMLLWHHSIMSVDTAEMAARVIKNLEIRTPSPQPREVVTIPEGWQLVPVAATTEMEAAAVEKVRPYHDLDKWRRHMPGDLFRLAWPALLSAAPRPVGTPSQVEEE